MQIREYKISDLDKSILNHSQKSLIVRLINRINQLYNSRQILIDIDNEGFVTFGVSMMKDGKELDRHGLANTKEQHDLPAVLNMIMYLLFVVGMIKPQLTESEPQWNDRNVDIGLVRSCLECLSYRVKAKTHNRMSLVVKERNNTVVIYPVCMGFYGPEIVRGGDEDMQLRPIPDIWMIWKTIAWMRTQQYL